MIVASAHTPEERMRGWRTRKLVPLLAAGAAVPAALLAQGASAVRRGAPFDACALATNAEVQQVAEVRPELARLWDPPEPSAGGFHCDYSGGAIEVYEPSQGQPAAARLERTLKIWKSDKEPRTPVRGLGDRAFFMVPFPNDEHRRAGLLAVYAGPRVVMLTLDARRNERIELTQPRLERFARLVLPRVK
jgi:hypothetical protein